MQARGGHTNYLNIILKHTSWHREADQGKRKDVGGWGWGGGTELAGFTNPNLTTATPLSISTPLSPSK